MLRTGRGSEDGGYCGDGDCEVAGYGGMGEMEGWRDGGRGRGMERWRDGWE